MSARGGSLPARGWDAAAGGVGGKQTGADLPGWRQLASAVLLDSQQHQHHRLDTTVQVSCHWLHIYLYIYLYFVINISVLKVHVDPV